MNLLKQRFADALRQDEVDLAGLALLATQILSVAADPVAVDGAEAATLQAQVRLGQLVSGAREALAGERDDPRSQAPAEGRAAALVSYLGQASGFAGNAENYYSANNSNLGWVLAERRGIPITLAIVYIHVGRSLGIDVRGIGFPGHFLVGVYAETGKDLAAEAQLIDPFNARIVTREECMQTLERQPGNRGLLTSSPVDDALFVAGTPHQIVLRLLENLKQIYLQTGATGPALAALDLQILAAPDSFELRTQHEALVSQVFGSRPGRGERPEVH